MSTHVVVGSRRAEPTPYFVRRGLINMLVPNGLLKCVVFLGTRLDGKFTPKATGFIVSYEQDGFRFLYLVTAEHVVSGLLTKNLDIWCRLDLTDGNVAEWEIHPDLWRYHPEDETNPTDVAICPVPGLATDPGSEAVFGDQLAVGLNGKFSIAATEDVIERTGIGVGEEVCIVGLFRSHYGMEKNIPIVRIGNIAMLWGDPILTDYKGFIQGYLIEARSIGGLSGSPVFVSMPPYRIIGGQIRATEGRQFFLLGLVHGHFDIADLTHDSVVDDGRRSGINTGIGVVIPVQKIIDAACHPELTANRRQTAMELRKSDGATPDMASAAKPDLASVETTGPNSDENPDHREDFNRLVSAASKSKPKGDRT